MEREGKGSTLTSLKVQVLDALLESPQPPCWSPHRRRLLAPEVEVRRKSTAQPVIVLLSELIVHYRSMLSVKTMTRSTGHNKNLNGDNAYGNIGKSIASIMQRK
jgi:hypothetical protein